MKLAHWHTEQKFKLTEAAQLIVGIDPMLKRAHSDTAEASSLLVLRQLENGYTDLAEILIKAISRAWSRGEIVGPDILGDLAQSQHIVSIDCLSFLANAAIEQWPYDGLQNVFYPLQTKLFSRDAISNWCARNGWDSRYDFSNAVDRKFDSRQEVENANPHPRSERNYLALIAAMAAEKYGYDPTAKKSDVPSYLAILLRRNGYHLTDEVIRKYLRDGAGHLNPTILR